VIFAALGYPYPVQKKCFAPLGATNTWKLLLAALCWLIDLVESGVNTSGAYESKQHEVCPAILSLLLLLGVP
jgi:HEC/Ndc80p family